MCASMTQGIPRTTMPWLSFRCQACRAELRIKAAYASMRGRCPECGSRIEPIRPAPKLPQRFSSADEPMGLVPIEEEWPEPAQVAGTAGPDSYELAAGSPTWNEPSPLPAPEGESYNL